MKSPGKSPVHEAVMEQSVLNLSRAIANGAEVDALDIEGRTPLFYAVRDGQLALVEKLIRNGAAVNAQDKALKTPLHFAAGFYQRAAANLLLRHGARIDSQDIHGNTPLSDAVFDSRGRGELVRLLLSSGASRQLKNNYGVSPEGLARTIANYDVIQFFD